MNVIQLIEVAEHEEDDEFDGCLDDCFELLEQSTSGGLGITQFRCGAHTQQLAIDDAFKKQNKSSVIENARRVCIKLRTPNVMALLKALQLPCPVLDCPTRLTKHFFLV